jgi:hypothetical protein
VVEGIHREVGEPPAARPDFRGFNELPEVAVPDAPVVAPASVTGGAYSTAALIVAALLADGTREQDAGSPLHGGAVGRRARHAEVRGRAAAGGGFA